MLRHFGGETVLADEAGWQGVTKSLPERRDTVASPELEPKPLKGRIDTVLKKLKAEFRNIRAGTPGRRFLDHYEETRRREGESGSLWRTAGFVAAGMVLLFGGLLLSLPPGVPGFLLWIPGLAMLAARLRGLATLLDRLEASGHKLRKRWRHGGGQ